MYQCTARSTQNIFRTLPPSSHHLHTRYRSTAAAEGKKWFRQELPNNEYNFAKRTTRKLIDHIAGHPSTWKDSPSLRGHEKKLASDVKNVVHGARRISLEQVAYDTDKELSLDDEQLPIALPPGTFMEARRNNISTYGVVVGQLFRERRRRLGLLTSTGEIWQPVQEDAQYVIPDLVTGDMATRCGIYPQAENDVQVNARVQVLKRLREFQQTLEVYEKVVIRQCHELYEKLRSPDPEAWSQTTIADVARIIGVKSNTPTLFAIHKYMTDKSLYFVAHESYELTKMFYVRPKAHIDNIGTIMEWSRQPENSHIQSFAEKAKAILPLNEEAHRTSYSELPSARPANHTWSDTDCTILTFLQNSLRRTRSTQSDPYSLGQSFILKRISLDRPPITDDTVYDTLVGLGVVPPWKDLVASEPALDFDQEPEATSSRVMASEAIAAKGLATINNSLHKTILGPEDFHPTDPLDSVRHDFGDLPVFVIDDVSAEELDDGISIERIPFEPSSFWVHAHIADPAALIPPTHVLAKEAYIRTETAYHINRSYPLFPRSLMKHPMYGLSLGTREDGQPTKVITFSSKINDQGELTDFKVRAGLIRNLNVVTYDEVDTALDNPLVTGLHPFGPPLISRPRPRTLSASQVHDLRDLQTTATRVIGKRRRDGVITLSRSFPVIKLVASPPPELHRSPFEPTIYKGFPLLDYTVHEAAILDSGARSLVAEVMKLASRVGSLFCTERGVPNIRRVADPQLMRTYGDPQEVLDMRSPSGYIAADVALNKIEAIPSGSYSLEPKAHYQLGTPDGEGYCRVTSPLRRYIDLVSHWQIHHALLGPAAPGSSPPFDSAKMAELCVWSEATSKLLKVVERNDLKFWQAMILKRWVDGTARGIERPDDVMQRLEAVTVASPTQSLDGSFHTEGLVSSIGLSANIEDIKFWKDLTQGSRVAVKVKAIRLGIRPKVSLFQK